MNITRRARLFGLIPVMALMMLGWRAPASVHANGVALVSSDVLAAVGASSVKHFDSAGTLKDTLNDTSGATYTTGMCFDGSGNLYVTNFSGGTISKFSASGTLITASFATGLKFPESCVVDVAGDIYVSEATDFAGIVKLNSSGTVLTTYAAGRTDWIALDADQCTMYFTDESSTIMRYNVCTNTLLASFVTLPSQSCFAMGIRPNGEMLVACYGATYRLSTTGAILQTYVGATYGDLGWFALSLDPDGTTFWTADINNGDIVHIDIATGNKIVNFNGVPLVDGGLAGLAVVGQINVGGGSGGTFTIPPSTRPSHAVAGITASIACPVNARFTLGLGGRVGFTGSSTGTFSFKDSLTGFALTTSTGTLVMRALTRMGNAPVNAGNSAVVYFSPKTTSPSATVRVDLLDTGVATCKDVVRVQTSNGYDSGPFVVPNVLITRF